MHLKETGIRPITVICVGRPVEGFIGQMFGDDYCIWFEKNLTPHFAQFEEGKWHGATLIKDERRAEALAWMRNAHQLMPLPNLIFWNTGGMFVIRWGVIYYATDEVDITGLCDDNNIDLYLGDIKAMKRVVRVEKIEKVTTFTFDDGDELTTRDPRWLMADFEVRFRTSAG